MTSIAWLYIMESMPETPELHQILGDLVVAAHRLTRLAARVTGSEGVDLVADVS